MSVVEQNVSLEPFNTFAVAAKARFYAKVQTPEDIRSVLADPRYGNLPCFVLGGGSNTLFTRDFDGLVLHMTGGSIELTDENDSFYFVRVSAGVTWDTFVRHAIDHAWFGLENLAAIPGTAGGVAVLCEEYLLLYDFRDFAVCGYALSAGAAASVSDQRADYRRAGLFPGAGAKPGPG